MSDEITINGEVYVKKIPLTGTVKHVLVRTYSAGVHFGELVKREGQDIELRNARHIWAWKGANTLSDIAEKGLKYGKERTITDMYSASESKNTIAVVWGPDGVAVCLVYGTYNDKGGFTEALINADEIAELLNEKRTEKK